MKVIKFETTNYGRFRVKYAIRTFKWFYKGTIFGYFYVDHRNKTDKDELIWRTREDSAFREWCLCKEDDIVEKWNRVVNWKTEKRQKDREREGVVVDIELMIKATAVEAARLSEEAARTEEEEINDNRIERMGSR